jgi:ribosomal protein S18 acetylase RimI-like enzyme
MAITIRRFEPSEWRMYRDLRLRALSDSPNAFGSTYAREATRSDSEWSDRLSTGAAAQDQIPLVALVDETPVGLAWGRQDEHEPTTAHLFQVWVSPEHRGQGVGRLLTTAVIAWANELGLSTLRLGVTASHPAALHLYRRAGFVDAGAPEALRPGSPVSCQPMQLALKASIQNRSA